MDPNHPALTLFNLFMTLANSQAPNLLLTNQPAPPPATPAIVLPPIDLITPPGTPLTPPDDAEARAEVNSNLLPRPGSALAGVGGGIVSRNRPNFPNFSQQAAVRPGNRKTRLGVSSSSSSSSAFQTPVIADNATAVGSPLSKKPKA